MEAKPTSLLFSVVVEVPVFGMFFLVEVEPYHQTVSLFLSSRFEASSLLSVLAVPQQLARMGSLLYPANREFQRKCLGHVSHAH